MASKSFIERQWEKARERRAYPFVIEKPSGTAVGFIGLFLKVPDGEVASVGYWVVPSARGRGTSAAALKEVARWALDDLSIVRLELYIEPWNQASIRSAERAGFIRETLLNEHQLIGDERADMFLYSLSGAPANCESGGPAPGD